jgi:hypothetical protein
MDEESGMETDSIKKLEADVWNHYKSLISNLKRNLRSHDNEGRKIQVGFELFVVSSLAAISSKSLVNLGNLLKLDNKQTRNLWAKRCVIASIKGSAKVWYRLQPRISEIPTNEGDIYNALSDFQDEGYAGTL